MQFHFELYIILQPRPSFIFSLYGKGEKVTFKNCPGDEVALFSSLIFLKFFCLCFLYSLNYADSFSFFELEI